MNKYVIVLKKTLGWLILIHILPMIITCASIFKGDSWWIGFLTGYVVEIFIVTLIGILAFVNWLIE